MKFRFIGLYTNGHKSITYGDVTFHGNEPSNVPEDGEHDDLIRRLSQHQEFEKVGGKAEALKPEPSPKPAASKAPAKPKAKAKKAKAPAKVAPAPAPEKAPDPVVEPA